MTDVALSVLLRTGSFPDFLVFLCLRQDKVEENIIFDQLNNKHKKYRLGKISIGECKRDKFNYLVMKHVVHFVVLTKVKQNR